MERTGTKERLKPTAAASWREVGWIFRDGDCIAIERQGDQIRSRVEEFCSRVLED